MHFSAPLHGIEKIHHLDDAAILQVKNDESGARGLQTSLAGDIVNHAEQRLVPNGCAIEYMVNGVVIIFDVVLVEYC